MNIHGGSGVLASSGVGTWSWHPLSSSLDIDEMTTSITGCTNGDDLFERIDWEDAMRLLLALSAGERHATPLKVQVRCHCPDGRVIWCDIRGGQIAAASGSADRLCGTLWDITENKLGELRLAAENQRLSRASSLRDEVIARLGHEMRTPLNAIIGYADLASAQARTGALRADIDRIRSNGRFMLRLMEDVLDLSRLEADKIELALQPVCLLQLLDEVRAAAGIAAARKHLALRVDVGAGLPAAIVTDPLRLRQILQNLLDNAVKFTERGEVLLTVDRVGNGPERTWVFEVRDTGPGIPAELRDRVFEPFVQANRRATGPAGLGMGLALSRRLARCFGGSLRLESTPGEGCRFILDLPVRPPDESLDPPLPTLSRPVDSATDRTAPATCKALPTRTKTADLSAAKGILLVEDHQALAKMTKRQLQTYGYEVRIASDGAQALREMTDWRPTAVIMDLSLPDTCGLALLRSLKNRPNAHCCRFVAYSGSSEPGDRQTALVAGFDAYFVKPADAWQLVAAADPKGLVVA